MLSIFVDNKTWARVPIRLAMVGVQRSAASLQLASFSLGPTVCMHVVERNCERYMLTGWLLMVELLPSPTRQPAGVTPPFGATIASASNTRGDDDTFQNPS